MPNTQRKLHGQRGGDNTQMNASDESAVEVFDDDSTQETEPYLQVSTSNRFTNQYRILVPVPEQVIADDDPEPIEPVLRSAEALAHEHQGSILLIGVVTISEQRSLDQIKRRLDNNDQREIESEAQQAYDRAQEHLESLLDTAERTHIDAAAHGLLCADYQMAAGILHTIERHHCDSVLLTQSTPSRFRQMFDHGVVETVLADADCDVFVENPRSEIGEHGRILLAAGSGPHTGLAAVAARALALESAAGIDIIHVINPDSSGEDRAEARRVLDFISIVLDDVEKVKTKVVEAENTAAEIIERSEAHDVAVLGAPTKSALRRFLFGSTPDAVAQQAPSTVLVARQGGGSPSSVYYRWKCAIEQSDR